LKRPQTRAGGPHVSVAGRRCACRWIPAADRAVPAGPAGSRRPSGRPA